VSKLARALGLMSGTSLDGIDVALVETDGEDVVRRGPFLTVPYDETQRAVLRQSLKDAVTINDRNSRPGHLVEAEKALTRWHADAVQAWVYKSGVSLSNIDVIGFHGQTVIHRPEKWLTVQLGDGAELARQLGVPVIYDMRAADVAAGGQGAPLVPVYHRALATVFSEHPVAFVNIGGVANVSWIGRDGELLAFDTGPGNALIDDWMKSHTGSALDENGRVALSGRVDEAAVAQFLGDNYFESPSPKSLDRNSFANIRLDGLSIADGAATLVAVTTRAIAISRTHFPEDPVQWIICGGGRHNRAIMQSLKVLLPRVEPAESFGFNGDAMEAEAWAYLAVRSLKGLPLSFPGTTGVPSPMTGGILVKPS
jgi:anhydro-N-acetylmuramic acid kinase